MSKTYKSTDALSAHARALSETMAAFMRVARGKFVEENGDILLNDKVAPVGFVNPVEHIKPALTTIDPPPNVKVNGPVYVFNTKDDGTFTDEAKALVDDLSSALASVLVETGNIGVLDLPMWVAVSIGIDATKDPNREFAVIVGVADNGELDCLYFRVPDNFELPESMPFTAELVDTTLEAVAEANAAKIARDSDSLAVTDEVDVVVRRKEDA